MRTRIILFVLVFALAAGTGWAQFYKDWSTAERKAMAESYWLAGRQYDAVGKTDKGAEYKSIARVLDPSLDPAAIRDIDLPSAAEILAKGKAGLLGSGTSDVPTAAIDSFFLRYVGAMLDGDSAAVAGLLDGSMYLTKTPAEVKNADARATLDAFFSGQPLAGKSASDLYDLQSIVVARVPQVQRDRWGDAYTLTVNARGDYAALPFWESRQQFFIRKTVDGWKIFAIGQSAPPISWTPQKAAPAAAAVTTQPSADPSADVRAAFTASMTALLSKDADGALKGVASAVRFLRLRQTVTRDELKTTLQGSWDQAGFTPVALGDAIDTASVFVAPADSPVETVAGPVYALTAKSMVDLSAAVPFWGSWMTFYFVQDGGAWLMIAIM